MNKTIMKDYADKKDFISHPNDKELRLIKSKYGIQDFNKIFKFIFGRK